MILELYEGSTPQGVADALGEDRDFVTISLPQDLSNPDAAVVVYTSHRGTMEYVLANVRLAGALLLIPESEEAPPWVQM